MTNPDLTKSQLRKQMDRLLGALTDLEKELESEQMVEKISHFISASPQIKTIASYAAMPSELNLDSLHTALAESPEVSFCYPRCGAEGRMNFHSVSNLLEMKMSDYGMREPDEAIHERVDPESIDLFLCPASAYTQGGERLGKGGGFYDRYLLQKRPDAITLGVVFSCQIVPYVPTDPHDLLIDRVL